MAGMRYSLDFRQKVVRALESGQSIRQVAKRFDINKQTVQNYKKLAQAGSLQARKCGPSKPTKITPQDEQLIRQLIAQKNDLTLKQLCSRISVPVAESTMSRTLKRLGLSFKKRR